MDAIKTGGFLAALRKSRGYTQQEVADQLNISNKTVSKWEQGGGYPDITLLPVLSELYEVTVDEILAGGRRGSCRTSAAKETHELRHHLLSRLGLRFDLCTVFTLMLALAGYFLRNESTWCVVVLLAALGALACGLVLVLYGMTTAEKTLTADGTADFWRYVMRKVFLCLTVLLWCVFSAISIHPHMIGWQTYLCVVVGLGVLALVWIFSAERWGSFLDGRSAPMCIVGAVVMALATPVYGLLHQGIFAVAERVLPPNSGNWAGDWAYAMLLWIRFIGVALIVAGVARQIIREKK